jgi:hypothetical protein
MSKFHLMINFLDVVVDRFAFSSVDIYPNSFSNFKASYRIATM